MSNKPFVKLREYQKLAVKVMLSTDRHNLFLPPGMGKTITTLYALAMRKMFENYDDNFPALIVSTHRIANTVWDAECDSWEDFSNLTYSKVIGDPDKRKKALQKKADIYITNFENLFWLLELLGNKWPFKTVIVDECTKIKGHRVSSRKDDTGKYVPYRRAGTKRASYFIRRSFDTLKWYNLTGTPTPKGVVDLWAICFPIDLGRSLGNTFSHFKERWFYPGWGSSNDRPRLELKDYAEEQILDLIKPYTLTIDAKDYFDIKEPFINDIQIDIPKHLISKYKILHDSSVMQLNENTIIEANEPQMKCRQFASGHILNEGEVTKLHSGKIEALKDLVDSLQGAPIIVAYHFKQDLKDLKKAFPEARTLPTAAKAQKKVEGEWNKGNIPMLLLHPQSAGHGLNLQHGGHHICFYTLDWNAEYYQQIIDRIGPVRQLQSGYDRIVYIHRIYMKNTWDEVVAKNIDKKLDNSDRVQAALKINDKLECLK